MADSSFETRVKTLAYQADLRISETTPNIAKLVFKFNKEGESTEQRVWIAPYGDTWEFSCMSFINNQDPKNIPPILLIYALQENAKNRRGCWTLNHYSNSDKYVLEYMANISSALLTPEEFRKTCNAVAVEVDDFERILSKI
jgi:hypothetical protein